MELTLRISNESEELTQAIEAFIEENIEGSDFLVCDETGKEQALKEYIEESLWAFNADFVATHMSTWNNMTDREATEIIKAIREMQEKLCELANPLVMAMIEDIEEFIEDAVSADGAGHFLSPYDGEETEFTFEGNTYYIYRTN